MVWGCLRNSDPGLKPPTCRWLISYPIEKSQGIQAPETSKRVVFPLKLHVTPAKSFRMCDLLVQTPWQDRRWRKFWEHLVQAHKDCWCIVCHGPLRIYNTHGFSRLQRSFVVMFHQPGDRKTSHHPKLIATTMLPPCYHQASPGEMLVECLGSEALPWRISWIRPLDWAQKLLETAWRFAWKARCDKPYKLGPRW